MTRKRVLVVEDDPGGRFSLHDYLAQEGYEVVEAANGEEALRVFHDTPPHAAARRLGVPRSTLYKKIRALSIAVERG